MTREEQSAWQVCDGAVCLRCQKGQLKADPVTSEMFRCERCRWAAVTKDFRLPATAEKAKA